MGRKESTEMTETTTSMTMAIDDALRACESARNALQGAYFDDSLSRDEAAEMAAELQDEAETLCDVMNTLIAVIAPLAAEAG